MNVIKTLAVRFIWILTVILVFGGVIFLGFLVANPVVQNEAALTPKEVRDAKKKAELIRQQFISKRTQVELKLTQRDIDALMAVISHSIPNVQFNGSVNSSGMSVAATMPVSVLGRTRYLNASCMLKQGIEHTSLQHCRIGHIPVPAGLLELSIYSGFELVFGAEVKQTFIQFISDLQIRSDHILLVSSKPDDFRQKLERGIKGLANKAKTFYFQEHLDTNTIDVYLHTLKNMDNRPKSLAPYLSRVMATALARTEAGENPKEQNTAALWALAIKFGSHQFHRLAGYAERPDPGERRNATLQGRVDLTLHFLYSAILEQLGRAEFAFNIGEIKEILDTNQGGSGYSFADLAADKAGLRFSEWIGDNQNQARQAQDMLALRPHEHIFFPSIQDVPEGFTDKEFKRVFKNTESKQYQLLVDEIERRIRALPLYNPQIYLKQ